MTWSTWDGNVGSSNIFCIFPRNTKLPNFVNIFKEKYSSNFYKQGVIWKVTQFRKLKKDFHLFSKKISQFFFDFDKKRLILHSFSKL